MGVGHHTGGGPPMTGWLNPTPPPVGRLPEIGVLRLAFAAVLHIISVSATIQQEKSALDL